jgi:hypothetical protein
VDVTRDLQVHHSSASSLRLRRLLCTADAGPRGSVGW